MKINLQACMDRLGDWFLTSGARIVFIVIGTLILLKACGVLIAKIEELLGQKGADAEYKKRASTLSGVLRWILRVGVLVVAFMMILREFNVDIGPVLAAAGVAGVAIGFGAQNLVQDFLAGFFLLLEDQIRVGDVVQINDKGGMVEQINLRMVVLRDLAGNAIFIRNGKIDMVTNMTKDYSRYVFDVGVAYREDVDEVIGVLKAIDEEMRRDPGFKDDILAPLEVLGLDSFGDSAVIIKARTMTKPIQQWRVGREFNRRMKKRFDELGIEIPFPHRTIYFGKDKQGQSPPLNVETSGAPENPNRLKR
ncbi:MAG: mechanosensitive ion channel family protein [Verrucomicrobiota bacterium]|nr:mechanosensitive ion channel family protein [Verrucomicrobiota bacterium]